MLPRQKVHAPFRRMNESLSVAGVEIAHLRLTRQFRMNSVFQTGPLLRPIAWRVHRDAHRSRYAAGKVGLIARSRFAFGKALWQWTKTFYSLIHFVKGHEKLSSIEATGQ